MDAVVFGIGGEGADPAVVASGSVEVDGVGEDGDLARGVGEVLVLDEFVIVRAAGVGEDFKVSSAGGSLGVGGVAIWLKVGCLIAGGDVPGAGLGFLLSGEMFGFDGNDAALLFEDEIGIKWFCCCLLYTSPSPRD